MDRFAKSFAACFVIACASLVVGTSTVHAQFLATQLRSLSRTGGQTGTSFELRAASGDHLDELDALYFSHPGITAELTTLDPLPFSQQRRPDFGNFTVTIASDVPPGRYEVCVGGRHGVSNPRAFLVSEITNEVVTNASHDSNAPTPLSLGKLVHAKAAAASIDYYGLTLARGQRIQIELVAQRIDSRMIGQLRMDDPSGRQIDSSRGADDVDPTMVFEAPSDGQFQLAVHDFTYRGGDEFPYQLLVQNVPSATELIRSTSGEESVPGRLPRVWFTRAISLAHR